MNRRFWITRANDFKRVRLAGKSYAHPLVVIIVAKGQATYSRAGIITGKSIGNAVKRNRARRRLRVIISHYLEKTTSPYDFVVISRSLINDSSFQEVQTAIQMLMVRAGMLMNNDRFM